MIRSRRKIEAIIHDAQRFIALRHELRVGVLGIVSLGVGLAAAGRRM